MKNYPALLSRLLPVSGRQHSSARVRRRAFSLVEVVMAVGVLGVTVVALLGLFGPTMSAVRNVVDRSSAQAAASRFNASLVDNEIYNKVSGKGMTDVLTDADLKNIEGKLGTYVESFGTSAPSVSKVLPFFAWKEYKDESEAEKRNINKLEFKLAGPEGQTPMPVLNGDFLKKLEGGIYLIVASEPASAVKPTTGSMVDNLGYLPVKVAVYAYEITPGENLANIAANATTTNNKINQYVKLQKGRPLIEYTTVISRP